jgi:hypothetical protein
MIHDSWLGKSSLLKYLTLRYHQSVDRSYFARHQMLVIRSLCVLVAETMT